MQRVVVLGGGVGGTLTANLVARKLKKLIAAGEVQVTVVDATGAHAYQPGYMYIAMGNERAEKLVKPERSLLDGNVELVVDTVTGIDASVRTVTLGSGTVMGYEHLVIATGSRIMPEEMPGFDAEAHHFYSAEAAAKLRKALDAFTGGRIVIGIAGIPYKCPPAPLEVAFLVESELRDRGLRDKTEITFLSPINRAFTIESVSEMATPIFEEKGIRLELLAGVGEIDAERKVVITDAFEEHPYDLLICVPPHRGAQVVIDSGLAPKSGWLPTDRHTLQVKTVAKPAPGQADEDIARYPDIYALGDATDLPLSKAGSTAHFEAPIVAERIAAAVEGREPEGKDASYTGKVMCFFEVGDGKGTLLQFDYEHPPKPPTPNRMWHLGKIVFNKTYWHTVPRGRI
ncbi:MAG TPA: FAD/NAD(P)-binding oxidoreductase [Candidatus Limnocylindrales bacterium]|nr:FAD/NAD(P)-binding oxidoreductase [Candidatus Limnocylindrales bacterium]